MKKIFVLFLLTLIPSLIFPQNLVLLVDKSGSLKTNDPQDLRKDALKFLIEQNNKYEQIAIYSFGSSVNTYYPNAQSIFINVKKDKDKILNIVQSLKREDALTNLKQGLSKIYDDLSRSNIWDNTRILLFTDAQLRYGDIPEGISITDYLNGVYEIAKLYASKNVPIDAIAFTKNANISYLQMLASLTNGFARHSLTPENIYETITEFDESRQGPFTPNKEIEINVSALVSSFKVLAFNKRIGAPLPSITLTDPNGKTDNDYIQSNYKTSITIEKTNPKQGIWKALVKGAADVEIYYNKKINYELVVNKPKAKDLSLCQYSVVPFDVDIKSENTGKLIGAKCLVYLYDSLNKKKNSVTLEKSGTKFWGNLKINQSEGIYILLIKLSSGNDFIEKKFTVRVEQCEDLIYVINHDIVLENPVNITLTKPSSDKSALNIMLTSPKNEKEIIELFDDGLEKHGDGFANDGILSNRIAKFNDAGMYQVEISLTYERDEIPVVNKNIETIYKVVSLRPKITEISYPDDSLWIIKTELNIINYTSFKVQLKELFPDIRYTDKIKIILVDSNLVILPREERLVKISIANLERLIGEHKLNNVFYCDLIDPQTEEYKVENAKIILAIDLVPTTPFLSKLVIFTIIILIVLITLYGIGLLLMIPLRFKNVVYYGSTNEIGISDYRKFLSSFAELDDGTRIGITFMGYGYWYLKDNENGIIKYFNNINLRKETF